MHLGIILDGNGRWATNQNLPRLAGHRQGVDTLKTIVKACHELGITTLTVFAFAIANWKRGKAEVDGLWELFRTLFAEEIDVLIEEGIRVKVIGRRTDLPKDIVALIERAESRSENNQTALLQIALNYDGVDEVARLLQRTIAAGLAPEEIDEAYVLEHLDTEASDDLDVLIRTGMPEPKSGLAVWRGSGFLPLQSAQSVCVATTTLWPDFTAEHLKEIITFAKPDERLFGGQRN